jgi:UDP-glucose 4-epimerase
MRILLTGATGFVGSAFIDHARHQGHEVIAAVRVSAPAVAAHEVRVTGPLEEVTDWSGHVRDVDAVVHAAAHVHVMAPRAGEEDLFHRVNVVATERLARAAAAAGARFVFVSSVKVHGDASAEALTERSPFAPNDPYGRSKLAAEERIAAIGADSGLHYTIVRPPLVYGPGVKANFLRLMRAVDRGLPLPFGLIRNRRSLVSVENLAAALLFAATEESARGRSFLVSDTEDVSSPELVRRIAAALGRPARLLPVPVSLLRIGGSLINREAIERLLGSLYVDPSALLSAGWKPAETMREGLTRAASWYIDAMRGTEPR